MDLSTLTLYAAGLVAKRFLATATNSTGDAGWKALTGAAGRIRDLLVQRQNAEGLRAYAGVEDAPDSDLKTAALATEMLRVCQASPDVEDELRRIVGDVKQSGFTFDMKSTGDHSPQFGNVVGDVVFNPENKKPVGTPGSPLCPACTSSNVKRKRVFYAKGDTHICRDCNTRF